jgi:hypothetical protein
VISFTAGGTQYSYAVPNGVIVLTNGATTAATSCDPGDNDWDTSAPAGGAGNVFMSGTAVPVTTALPGGIKNVTWSAGFWSDTPNVTVNWRWGAAVYSNFSGDNNAVGVKPVDNNNVSIYQNGDHAGSPEGYKSFITKGGTGDGGKNYTGNLTGASKVEPTLGDGAQDYPYASSNPLTSIAFNESTVLKAANLDTADGFFQLWYSDEHAMALGVGSVTVNTLLGSTTTNYDIAPLTSNPGSAHNPAVGTTASTGDQSGNDTSGRPMTPTLWISDTTTNANNRSGDWQSGGTPYYPSDVFGTWKTFTKTVTYGLLTSTTTVNTGTDPAKNGWNLGAGADPAPAGLTNEGYGTEVRWDLNALFNQGVLQAGHSYRFYVMVHDGDQNKSGGDAGQAAFNYTYPGPQNLGASLAGNVFADVNFNGSPDAGEGLQGAIVTLSGFDTQGHAVTMTVNSAADGTFMFTQVPAGTYSLTVSPGGVTPGPVSVGSVNGSSDGTLSTDGTAINNIVLGSGDQGLAYNFAFYPMA